MISYAFGTRPVAASASSRIYDGVWLGSSCQNITLVDMGLMQQNLGTGPMGCLAHEVEFGNGNRIPNGIMS